MDIKKLLEQKRSELYDYDYVYENMGDITDDMGDITGTGADYTPEGLTQKDMMDIELEASTIDDPDEFIDEATEEFNKEAIKLSGEMYMEDLIVEEALFNCETITDLEIVEESLKETVQGKAKQAVDKIKELWKKFKAWMLNLKNVIVNMFTSGAKLVEKHAAEIRQQYQARGKKIKVKCYDYKLEYADAVAAVEGIKDIAMLELKAAKKKGEKMDSSDGKNVVNAALNLGEGKEVSKENIKKRAAACVRGDKDKKEYKIADLDLNAIMDICANKKDMIKNMKDMEKAADEAFKEAIAGIKEWESPSDDAAAVSKHKKMIDSHVKFAKFANSAITTFIKAFISEVKAANRACSAIIRKLLNQSTAGGDTETKLSKKLRGM